jgi:hypothetical protein
VFSAAAISEYLCFLTIGTFVFFHIMDVYVSPHHHLHKDTVHYLVPEKAKDEKDL